MKNSGAQDRQADINNIWPHCRQERDCVKCKEETRHIDVNIIYLSIKEKSYFNPINI